ncbi:P-loop containing nucleoside triphosphate hydrolase protein [Pisolithus marmoratus]|nr:P-loop containing nucleoside triphosphate hydrolase protein [Pisolithus marmoratus]
MLGGKRKQESLEHPVRKKTALDTSNPGTNNHNSSVHREAYWMIQWRFPQYKKHKTWDGDAVLVMNASKGTLYDLEGKFIGSGSLNTTDLVVGGEYACGGREIGVDHSISRSDYLSGRCFGRDPQPTPTANSSALSKQFVPLKPNKLTAPYKAPAFQRPAVELEAVDLSSMGSSGSLHRGAAHAFWTANWRKPQTKKHKTWDGDAFVSLLGKKLTVISQKGTIIGRKDWSGHELQNGYRFYIGSKEVELDAPVEASQIPRIIDVEIENHDPSTEDADGAPATTSIPSQVHLPRRDNITHTHRSHHGFISPVSFYGQIPETKPKGPLHDPDAEGAVVMKMPSNEHSGKFNKKGLPVIPVVLDPIVARHLRPHQIEGVKFLYECVMGMRKHEGQGCILADEMGLGKTLQAGTIALVWTLLRQNPYGGGGVIGRALIVCPVSLINNWRAEFRKWLGRDRVGVFTGEKDKSSIKHFINSRIHQILVIGYEKLRGLLQVWILTDEVYSSPPIGLIICDEGHRLKSANNKTSTMFKALRTPRRIILSGTPIQNDLSEFHAMADFCNPGLLDDYPTFRRVYEVPILKSRAPDCTAKELELGEARAAQLTAIGKSFVLRREASILKNYLPPKHEYVVFVTPTQLQLSMFAAILHPEKLAALVEGSTAESLALINMLTKVSNSPVLLKAQVDKAKLSKSSPIVRPGVMDALDLLPENTPMEDFSISGKLTALANLLRAVRGHTEEKCIIVSHYTSTLNVIEAFCKKNSYTYLRLDGQVRLLCAMRQQTPANKRQEFVNVFNKSPQQSHFLFLLSAKAGGVGLNLIGASRLCLIDSDWNPSHDLQSMARIHRDGQRRPVFIYRFLTAGTIDEKIYQRQVTKIGLSDSLMGTGSSGSKADSFTRKELRDIFRVHPATACHTHALLGCGCGGRISAPEGTDDKSGKEETFGEGAAPLVDNFVVASQLTRTHPDQMDKADLQKKRAELADLGNWTHIDCLRRVASEEIQDDILRHLLHFTVPTHGDLEMEEASRLDKLLAAADLDNVAALSDDTSLARDVPGGTISFLFEKISMSSCGEHEAPAG